MAKRKEPRIVFVFITCEGCQKRYSAGIVPDNLPETIACPGCGTEIEIVREAKQERAAGRGEEG